MKNQLFVLTCFLLILLGSALPSSADQESTKPARADQADPIKIGVIIPLTGGWAAWGEKIQQALELTKEKLNHKVEFVYQDEGFCEAAKGVSAAHALFTQGIRIFIIGCVATTTALIPESKRNGMLIFSAGMLVRNSFTSGAQVVNFAGQGGTEAEYLAAYIRTQGYRTAAIVHPQEPFGLELAEVLQAELEKLKVDILFSDSDSFASNDFRPLALKIVQRKPDVLVMNLGESQQHALVRRLNELGRNVPILSTYGLESNITSPENIKILEGITYTYPFNSNDRSAEKLDFDALFAQRYGKNALPNANGYFAYDGLRNLDRALDNCAANDTGCIFRYFTGLGKVNGISGDVEYRADGSTQRPYIIKRVIDGKFVVLK